MNRVQWHPLLELKYSDIEAFSEIDRTLRNMYQHFWEHESILISVSGGSDSDCIVHLVCTYFPEFLNKCHFVFANTGLEWNATIKHLKYLENKYNIEIKKVQGIPIVLSVRKYGFPLISKYHSEIIDGYTRGASWAIRKINVPKEIAKGYTFSDKQKNLAKAVKSRGLKVSDKCCKYSKKQPIDKFAKLINCDLLITGERKCEGGNRSMSHKSCFECASTKRRYDKFMPIWWWNDRVKTYFKQAEGIKFSDCYEVYGFKRTGCCGCPLNSRVHYDLTVMKQHEPNLYKACINVFGDAYRIMDEFEIRKIKILEGLE